MSDPEHVGILSQGISVWNDWRDKNDVKPDLSGTDVASILKDRLITDQDPEPIAPMIDFEETDLRGANLAKLNLILANLENADLRNADLIGAHLGGTNLRGANIANSTINDVRFWTANLSRVDATGSQMWNADFGQQPSADRSDENTRDEPEINTVNDLLNVARVRQQFVDQNTPQLHVALYFRGEFSDDWQLRPSVMRPSDSYREGGLRKAEHEMLTELMARQPEDFHNTRSAFAQLVLARHHGLPTRLLDVTRNPLVALYSACEDVEKGMPNEQQKNGHLHVFSVPEMLIRRFDSDSVSVVSNFTRLSRGEKNALLTKLEEDIDDDDDESPAYYIHNQPFGYSYRDILARLRQFIAQEKPYFVDRIDPRDFFRVMFVEPQQSFARIRAQSGAFMISAFHERFEEIEVDKRNAGLSTYVQHTLSVPLRSKRDILDDLRRVNISRESLFPGLDSATSSITARYKVN